MADTKQPTVVDEEKAQLEQEDHHAKSHVTAVPTMGGEFATTAHPNPKAPFDETISVNSLKDDGDSQTEEITDTFVPFPPLKGVAEEPNPLTFRAVVVGIILGSLVNASNVYLGMTNQKMHRSLTIALTNNRSQDWFHFWRIYVWCHLRLWHRQAPLELCWQHSPVGWTFRPAREQYRPSICDWCWRSLWPLRGCSASHVPA